MGSRIDNKSRSFVKRWEYIGKRLKKVLIFLFTVVTLFQLLALLNIDGFPPNSTLKMEGKAIIENLFDYAEGEITLKADRIDRNNIPIIIVNGVEKCLFDKKNIIIRVKEADIIEINGVDCSDQINIVVSEVSDNISIPKVKLNYNINKNLVYLFRIKMK